MKNFLHKHGDSRRGNAKAFKAPPEIEIHDETHNSLDNLLPANALNTVYKAKAQVLESAIQEVGVGRYQWQLVSFIGLGWTSDNLCPVVTSLILIPVVNEFNPSWASISTLSQNIGMFVGAIL